VPLALLVATAWGESVRRRIRSGFLAWATMAVSSSAAGQTAALPEQPLLGSTLTADIVRDLPTGNSPFAVLETIQPEAIGNRFASGVLTGATAPQFGAFLNSWTQTQFRIGDIAISDPRAGGTPLLLPILPVWERMTTLTGAMGVDDNAPALSMTLEPRRPGTKWFRAVEGSLSGPPLVSEGIGPAPAVDRVHQWQDGSVLMSGPVTDRLGLVAAGSWRGLSHVAAPTAGATSDRVASGFAHLVFAASPRDEVRALGWGQRVTSAAFTDAAVHVQSTWERRSPTQLGWRVFGGYTERRRTASVSSERVVDSLASDPVSDLIDEGAGTARRWVFGARAALSATRPLPTVGVDLEGAHIGVAPTGIEQIRELVNGMPARAWTFRGGGATDVRHLSTVAVHGNERITFRRLTLDAGVRLEAVRGAARESVRGIHWTTWLPRTMLRWQIVDTAGLALVASYRRSAYQLPLNVLAIGDPAAPVADVSVWNGISVGPLIARVGPGTGGDGVLTQIDPHLRRPTTDELVLALVSRPIQGLQLELARITKREQPLLGLLDMGVDSSEYTALQVPDASFEPGSPVGGPQVTVYNRPPNSYGRDRYVLTNQAGDPARSWGLQATVRASTDRFTLLGGAALTWARGPAAAVGFLPTENDQDALGNLFIDPNAATAVRGQLFQDRSHVVKIAGIYRFPWRIRLGAIARYQDGQPFARLVIAPDLVQGPTAVRSYANGGSAFTYTGTLDIRVQKVFETGRSQVAAVVDVYNVPNLGKEVSEHVVSGPMFRTPAALQPPRTAVLGMRVTF
jgi:hypothetical protein